MCSGRELSFGSVSVAQSLLACQWESRLWSQFGLLSVQKEWTQVLLQHRDYFSRLIPVRMVMTFIQSMELYPLILVLVTVTQFRSHCHCSRVGKKCIISMLWNLVWSSSTCMWLLAQLSYLSFQIWLKYLGWTVLNWHPAYTHEEELFICLLGYPYIYISNRSQSGIWLSCCWWRTVTKFQEVHTVGWVCEWLTWFACSVLQLKGMEWMLAKQVLVDFGVSPERFWWSSVCSCSVCCSVWSAGLLHLLVSSGLCRGKENAFLSFSSVSSSMITASVGVFWVDV